MTGPITRHRDIDRWAEFEGAGIYFAATELEARACGPDPVAVVGGANSAGRAALYLAGRGNAVTLIVRGNDWPPACPPTSPTASWPMPG
jgi:thioredoxin reductase (NADPH)